MIRALIFILIFVVGCINKPPASSQYLEKGYFEDLSFLRESPEKNNVDSNNINEISIIEESKFNKELENIYITYENTPKNKYLNGYTIQIFSGLEREKAAEVSSKLEDFGLSAETSNEQWQYICHDFGRYWVPLLSYNLFTFLAPHGGINNRMKKQFANGYKKFDFRKDLVIYDC